MMIKRWKPSVTVAAVVARDFAGVQKFLLVEEQTRDGLKLNNPAGHLDPGEGLIEACVRETLEETAHHFTPTALVGTYLSRFAGTAPDGGPPMDITYLRFAFCGELGAHIADRALDHGIVRSVWLSLAEIQACESMHRSPMLMACLRDYLAGRRYPLGMLHTDASVYQEHPGLSAA
jgi:8-oxo-dGTP pyrophosphatase MutT (NUDIX family)